MSTGGAARFVTTQWSVVLDAAQPGAAQSAALEELCRAYWYPIYAHVRRSGHGVEDARDLTQEFFARLLERQDVARVRREKGRFRSFLLVALQHFLASEWRRANAQKRGGRLEFVSLDEVMAEKRYAAEPAQDCDAATLFDRRWALTLLEQVLAQMRREYEQAGKGEQFSQLKGLLSGDGVPPYAELGARIGLSEGATKVAAHRLRQRYLALLSETIAQTVANPAEVEDELRYLVKVLSG